MIIISWKNNIIIIRLNLIVAMHLQTYIDEL